jgi:hypothetical protein
MKSVLAIAVVLVFFSCLESCHYPDDAKSSGQSGALFPLAKGDKWDYDMTMYATDGSIRATGTMSVQIDSIADVSGYPTFFGFTDGKYSGVSFYYRSASSLYKRQGSTSDEPFLRFDIGKGEEAVLKDTTYEDGFIVKTHLVFRDSGITTTMKAGTFKCFKYDIIRLSGYGTSLDTGSVSAMLFARGVGLVTEDDSVKGPTSLYLKTRQELVSYVIH